MMESIWELATGKLLMPLGKLIPEDSSFSGVLDKKYRVENMELLFAYLQV